MYNRSLNISGFVGYLILIAGFFFADGCTGKKTSTHNQAVWSSKDPFTIPYQVRNTQKNSGNIVHNPSFELGKFFSSDTIDLSFSVHGWNKVGEHVKWVSLDRSNYSENEVSEGIHSIKIERESASETDLLGEGIMSDFIRVIPGNYSFSYDIRLENISPSTLRLGTKIHQAVNIRLLYYDKNKIPVDGKCYYPYTGTYIDNSFKGYSFSNFWHIDKFDWARVNGRSYNYPFSEGDIPDNARYVKIFLGLKGTGTMWIDNVDFRYSRWNFSTLERLEPFIDHSYSKSDLLLPAPKVVKETGDYSYFLPDSNSYRYPVILVPSALAIETMAAAQLLKQKLDTIFIHNLDSSFDFNGVEIISYDPGILTDTLTTIFCLGRNNLFRQYSTSLPLDKITEHQQGYFIYNLPEKPKVIFITGNNPVGDYYAVTTLIQLLNKDDFILHSANIIDWPNFTGRSYLFSAWMNEEEMERDISLISEMSLLKFNKAYVGYGQTRGRKDWYAPDDLYKTGVKNAGVECKKTGVTDLAIMVNPYYHFDYEMHTDSLSEKLRYIFVHSDPKSIKKLKSVYRIGLLSGAKTLMLMADDFVPHEGDYRKLYALYTPEDKKRFVNLQNAQAHMVNEIYSWLENDYPGTRLEFCPPWYLNEFIDKSRGRAEQYFRDLIPQIPGDVAVIWTGPTVRSLSIDMADIFRYKKLIGRNPMLWDNTLYARGLSSDYGGYPALYPGKVKMCNLFEPYDVNLPESFEKYNDGPHMYINGAMTSEQYQVKYSTVADYEWNTSGYDPDFSLWKTLLSRYGKETAVNILKFNDIYYSLKNVCLQTESEQNVNKLIKRGNTYSNRLQVIYSLLENNRKTYPRLFNEITGFKNEALQCFESFKDNNSRSEQ
ncbi:MAG: beta-N-acetylglucosaminidase domain-containing protein [Bacteroidetes bacterium]|nr:beta-N-acetylglucosaminidase domain-containing protein [Bacteroidota bacterium]